MCVCVCVCRWRITALEGRGLSRVQGIEIQSGKGGLVGYSPWGLEESDMTKHAHIHSAGEDPKQLEFHS